MRLALPTATSRDAATFADQLRTDGYAIVADVIDESKVLALRRAIEDLPESEEVRRRANVYGVRNLLEISPAIRELAAGPEVRSLASAVLGEHCFAVRATFFDKVAGANWNLRWHQDGAIAVQDRIETPDYTAWAQKAGVWQVRPPFAVLAGMLAIRVHLDPCPAANGALRVLAGSHTKWWPREELDQAKRDHPEVVCEVPLGGVLAMRPTTLHASSAALSPAHRRVIHIEFADDELPGELDWRSRIA